MTWIRRLGTATVLCALSTASCRRERPQEHSLVAEPGSASAAIAPGLEIVVTEVRGDASIDVDGARHALCEAESAFLSCLDPDPSTGVIELRIPVERDGAALDVALLGRTTYGTEEARACVARIVSTMRFPRPSSFTEVQATLEVRSRGMVPR